MDIINQTDLQKSYTLDREVYKEEFAFIRKVLTHTYKVDRPFYFELLGNIIGDLNKTIFKLPDLTSLGLHQLLKNVTWIETTSECIDSNFYRIFYTQYEGLQSIPKVIPIDFLNDDVIIRLRYDHTRYFVNPYTNGLRWCDVKNTQYQFLHLILIKQNNRWLWIDYSFGLPCQASRLVRKAGRITVKEARGLGVKWVYLY